MTEFHHYFISFKLVKAKTEVQIAEKQQNDMQTALFKQKVTMLVDY